MRWLVLVAASMLAACGGFELDTHVWGGRGNTLLIDGQPGSLDQSWSFPSYVDALEHPPTITVSDSAGHEYEAELGVEECAYDGHLDWDRGELSYGLLFGVDAEGRKRLYAGATSGACSNATFSVVFVTD